MNTVNNMLSDTIRALMWSLLLMVFFSIGKTVIAAEMVNTPFGMFPKKCVIQHPNHTVIEETSEGLKASYTDGTSQIYKPKPNCIQHVMNMKTQYKDHLQKKPAQSDIVSLPISHSWFNFVSWTMPSAIKNYSAEYIVPQTPTNISNQTLFYFIGVQNSLTIIQPVLGFENQAWNISSWNCCIAGHVNYSPFIYGIEPGDIISGSIELDEQGGYEITTSWREPSTTASTTLITKAISDPFTWINATLEVYYINSCDEFSSGVMTFYNMMIEDMNGSVTPDWAFSPPHGKTICNGQLQVDGDIITIQENIIY